MFGKWYWTWDWMTFFSETVFPLGYLHIASTKHAKLTFWSLKVLLQISYDHFKSACSIIRGLFIMLLVVAPRFVDKLWAFSKLQRSQSPLRCFRSALSTCRNGNLVCSLHTARVIGHLSFSEQIHISALPLLRFLLAHSAVRNLSQRNPVSTVWPPFHYALTLKCLFVKSAGFGGGDPHPCYATSSPHHSSFIRGEDIHGRSAISAIIQWMYTLSHMEPIVQRHHQSCTILLSLTRSNVLNGHSA